ncbi:NodB-like proteiny domain-containing protein [Mycena chlorophos]|uniref:chitin deacetylase n=1 Tax=Mycena chlorophos TaxID=658473 RepID=A0A8H6WN58_MYCCL|nr:NodB-like proteiny domain-containing protein [Mycena chlorophos]
MRSRPTLVLQLLAIASLARAHDVHADHLAKRQTTTPPPAAAPTTSPAAAAASGTVVAGVTIPPLDQITLGMPAGPTPVATRTASPGAAAPIASAPPLPNPAWAFEEGQWPTMDKPIDLSFQQDKLASWMKELDGYDIPDIPPTVDGTCVSDPTAAADAEARGWWTCGGYTRDTDITACPTKYNWGVSFDDGPAPYTPNLLNFLQEKNITATFFVVGSRVISFPDILINEYMAGHEIAVHTWSHPHLTTLSNEQIVAELGWTRLAIQSVLGVTPTTMRPPYGDTVLAYNGPCVMLQHTSTVLVRSSPCVVEGFPHSRADDRVRAISLAMGLIPVIWTRTPAGVSFDTFDWEVAGGIVEGPASYAAFQNILGNASELDTGFLVLQHDLYEITVDLSMGYTIKSALEHNPPFTLQSAGRCNNIPQTNLYVESNQNKSFPYPSPPASLANSSSSNGGSSSPEKGKTAQQEASGTSGVRGMCWDWTVVAGMLLLAASALVV